jgi:hypothetical protein
LILGTETGDLEALDDLYAPDLVVLRWSVPGSNR